MASSKSLPGVRMVTPTGRPATRSSSGSSTASRSRARRAPPPAPPVWPVAPLPTPAAGPALTLSTRRSATPRPAMVASRARRFPRPTSLRAPRPGRRRPPARAGLAVLGAAALLELVGGGDGPGDQGRRHVAVGQDPVVEAAQPEGVAQAGLGS